MVISLGMHMSRYLTKICDTYAAIQHWFQQMRWFLIDILKGCCLHSAFFYKEELHFRFFLFKEHFLVIILNNQNYSFIYLHFSVFIKKSILSFCLKAAIFCYSRKIQNTEFLWVEWTQQILNNNIIYHYKSSFLLGIVNGDIYYN